MIDYLLHNKKYFYKYLSFDTAILILTNRKFRYNSPLLFNDPFDVQTEITFDFEISQIQAEFVNEMIRLASSENEFLYEGNMNRDLIESIKILRKHVKKDVKVNPHLKNGLIEIFKEMEYKLEETRLNYNYMWQEFLKTLRVFSLSINYKNILMWSHYAKNHTGVVFKLKVLPDEGNLICTAEPVIYQNKPPKFFSKKEFINDMLGIKTLDFNKLYSSYARIKYDLWTYEDEWRVWTFDFNNKNQLFTDYKLYPNELDAIYFGCNTKNENVDKIKDLSLNINSKINF